MKFAITGINARMGLLTVSRLFQYEDEYEYAIEEIRGLDIVDPEQIHDNLEQILEDEDLSHRSDEIRSKLTLIQGDVRSEEDMNNLVNDVDILLHLAFIVLPLREYDRQEIEDVNINGSKNVFTQAGLSSVRKIVYLSSVASYGKVEEKNKFLQEDDPVRGSDFHSFYYSYCKGRVEEILDDIQLHFPNVKVTRIRPHIIAGRHYYKVYRRSLFDAEISARDYGEELPIILPQNQDEPLMQLVHEQDVADTLFHAVRDVNTLTGAYNLGGTPVNKMEFFADKDIEINKIKAGGLKWYFIKTLLKFSGLFSTKHKVISMWFELNRWPPIMDSSKIERFLERDLITTEKILQEFWNRDWED